MVDEACTKHGWSGSRASSGVGAVDLKVGLVESASSASSARAALREAVPYDLTGILRGTALIAMLAMGCPLACGGKATTTTTTTSPAEASAAGTGSAGDAGSAADAGPCPVLSSQYDQSCSRDSDCLVVDETISCPATICSFCGTGVINKQANFSKWRPSPPRRQASIWTLSPANCGAEGLPCCRMGLCRQCE